ncbi:hypothetical protein SPFM15_00230 [Salmonella phage SPFM15]|nr:hypothetical protein SPFM15_00230 [Salmonella phage SPFM15]
MANFVKSKLARESVIRFTYQTSVDKSLMAVHGVHQRPERLHRCWYRRVRKV